jgi:hypothetical protein
MLPTPTVNVVTIRDGVVFHLLSFTDNEEGNKEAEQRFKTQCELYVPRFREWSPEQVDALFDNGYVELLNGSICLAHGH